MPMKNPPHPGGVVLRQCIEPLGVSITDAAAALGVTRTTLSELVNGKRGISPEMAVRLEKVFGGSAESWLVQQAQYDLAQVRPERHDTAVAKLNAPVGVRSQLRVVGYQKERRPFLLVQFEQQLENVAAVGGIQIAGGLIGQ